MIDNPSIRNAMQSMQRSERRVRRSVGRRGENETNAIRMGQLRRANALAGLGRARWGAGAGWNAGDGKHGRDACVCGRAGREDKGSVPMSGSETAKPGLQSQARR